MVRVVGPDELAALFPDTHLRKRLADECPRLPLALFQELLPPSLGWSSRPCAYVRLSVAYDDSARQAEALGWRVIALDGYHLSVVTQAELVMEAVLDSIAQLRERNPLRWALQQRR